MEKVFTLAARFEAFTWAGLLLGMFVKYQLELWFRRRGLLNRSAQARQSA